jgi:hypothetical protein
MPDPSSGFAHTSPTSQPESLVDVLDKLLDTGVVLDGQIVIALAGVDLIHIGLRALVASVDTAIRLVGAPARPLP